MTVRQNATIESGSAPITWGEPHAGWHEHVYGRRILRPIPQRADHRQSRLSTLLEGLADAGEILSDRHDAAWIPDSEVHRIPVHGPGSSADHEGNRRWS